MTDRPSEGKSSKTKPGDWERINSPHEGEFLQRFETEVPPWGCRFRVLEEEWDESGGGPPRRTIKRVEVVSDDQ